MPDATINNKTATFVLSTIFCSKYEHKCGISIYTAPLGGGVVQLLERGASDHKVAGLVSVLGSTLLCLSERLNTNFLTSSLYDVKDSTDVCFEMAYTGEKKLEPNKQADMVLPVSSKVSLDNNFPMLNIDDVVPKVMRINRTNQLIN